MLAARSLLVFVRARRPYSDVLSAPGSPPHFEWRAAAPERVIAALATASYGSVGPVVRATLFRVHCSWEGA